MATTESRTGFRLPWSADRSDADAGDETPDGAPATTAGRDDAGAWPDTDAAEADAPARADGGSEPAAVPVMASTPARRPSKFLADLTRAMQAAAETAREATLTQFQSDAKAFVEQIHARSAGEATDLRQRADDDVAAIREWSKAEIARIREETERRISDRKSQLEHEVEDHAALIEREIERVQARVAEFEAEMERFFERLRGESDPTRFAAMAESLPEPPSFDDLRPTLAELEAERVQAAQSRPAQETVPEADATVEAMAAEPAGEQPDAADAAAATDELGDATAGVALPAEDLDAAFAAIQAAAEAAESADASDAGATDVADGAAGADATDPRVAALGLTPDFAAAEAEALAAADAGDDIEIPEIGSDALTARLASLTPAPEAAHPDEPAAITTRVVTVGLVSVASIASFKRHLTRVAGVRSVGVSSGPSGEFVFAVTHDPGVDLALTIPTLQGFNARVTGTGDGTIDVTASDPESEA